MVRKYLQHYINNKLSENFTSKTVSYFISVNWMGYFTDSRPTVKKRLEDKWFFDLNLKFALNNYEFSASGYDDIGPFAIKYGKIKGKDCQLFNLSTHFYSVGFSSNTPVFVQINNQH